MWIGTKVHLRQNTREDYEYMYNTYVRSCLGRNYLTEITTAQIKQHYNSLIVNRCIKVETVAHIQNIVYQVFQSAKESGNLINNPARCATKEFRRSRSKHRGSRKALTVEGGGESA